MSMEKNYLQVGGTAMARRNIKFKFEYSKEQITFLDTRVKIDKTFKTLFTGLYTKDTDTHNYLHYTSAHPSPL